MIKIVIPSYRRAGKVKTLDSIPLSHKDNTFLYVRQEELEEYSKLYSSQCNVVALPSHVNGIASTRTEIVKTHKSDKIWMLDDDITLFTSGINGPYLRPDKKINEEQFYDCLALIESLMNDGYSHGHTKEIIFPLKAECYPFIRNAWGFTNVYLDMPELGVESVVYEPRAEFLEDLFAFLTLHAKGYRSAQITKFLSKSSPSNSAGGCSVARDSSRFNRSAEFVYENFPQYVSWAKTRYDANIVGEEPRKSLKVNIRNAIKRLEKNNPSTKTSATTFQLDV